MAARIYDYVGAADDNLIKVWVLSLPKKYRAKVNAKVNLLAQYGDETLPGFVTPAVGSGTIKEIVIGGDRALRLLLCRGPMDIGRNGATGKNGKTSPWAAPEYTLLFGAEERDSRYVPHNAVRQAEARRQVILKDPKRRVPHVHVGSADIE